MTAHKVGVPPPSSACRAQVIVVDSDALSFAGLGSATSGALSVAVVVNIPVASDTTCAVFVALSPGPSALNPHVIVDGETGTHSSVIPELPWKRSGRSSVTVGPGTVTVELVFRTVTWYSKPVPIPTG